MGRSSRERRRKPPPPADSSDDLTSDEEAPRPPRPPLGDLEASDDDPLPRLRPVVYKPRRLCWRHCARDTRDCMIALFVCWWALSHVLRKHGVESVFVY